MAETVPCAGAIVFDARGRVLLVRRAHDPQAGRWSLPGGRCLPDEPAPQACIREVGEETGLALRIVRSVGIVHRAGVDAVLYAIEDFLCDVVGGTLTAGDDAADVRWASAADLALLDLVDGLEHTLAGWNLLPR